MTRYSERWSNRADRLNNVIQRVSSWVIDYDNAYFSSFYSPLQNFLYTSFSFFIENWFRRISTIFEYSFDTGHYMKGINHLTILLGISIYQRFIIHREALINERSRVDQSPRISLSLVTRSPAEILLVYLRSRYLNATLAYLICARRKYKRWIGLQQWRNTVSIIFFFLNNVE